MGIIISFGREQQANDLPIVRWKFLRIPERTQKKTPQNVGCSNYGGREENVPVCAPSAISLCVCKWSFHRFFCSLAISPSLPSATLDGHSLNHSLTHCSRIWLYLQTFLHRLQNPLLNCTWCVFVEGGYEAEPQEKKFGGEGCLVRMEILVVGLIVFGFIIGYNSSLIGFWPLANNNNNRSIFFSYEDFWKIIFWLCVETWVNSIITL